MRKICIVGGGSSGWMTAAALSKKFPQWDITLVESQHSKPLGVGESTLGHFNRYLDCLGIEDKDWMPSCKATYKLSISRHNIF
jgi:2-polyprenyl-6-methoxyphenol hydroxylase-like FAD-dependent oxidoreductase